MEIQLRNSAPTVESPSSKNKNTNADKINIGMYRELIVVTGVVICKQPMSSQFYIYFFLENVYNHCVHIIMYKIHNKTQNTP